MTDFVISMKKDTLRWRFKLDRPNSSTLCILTVETRRAQRWADKHLDECEGCYLYWLPRSAVGRLVRSVKRAGFSTEIRREL